MTSKIGEWTEAALAEDPAIVAILIEGYRKMSAAQKLERVRAPRRAVDSRAVGCGRGA